MAPENNDADGVEVAEDVEYGQTRFIDPDDADKVVRVVTKFNDELPSPEHASVTCHDCDRDGYALCCHGGMIADATPKTWLTVFVCRDCASRDDPLCGEKPADIDHPLVLSESEARKRARQRAQ